MGPPGAVDREFVFRNFVYSSSFFLLASFMLVLPSLFLHLLCCFFLCSSCFSLLASFVLLLSSLFFFFLLPQSLPKACPKHVPWLHLGSFSLLLLLLAGCLLLPKVSPKLPKVSPKSPQVSPKLPKASPKLPQVSPKLPFEIYVDLW